MGGILTIMVHFIKGIKEICDFRHPRAGKLRLNALIARSLMWPLHWWIAIKHRIRMKSKEKRQNAEKSASK